MEEVLNDDTQTVNIRRRGRWYTRLWHSCLGLRCMHPQKKKKFRLHWIGYDPIGPLQRAASMGDLDTVERLIHSSQHHVDESDRRNRTSLHYACAHNHPDVVALLLENNSSIDILDDAGCTPLIKATQRDNVDCVSVLLTHNADPNLIDFSGNTAFHHAASRGNISIVKMLLEHNVDIEAKTEYGMTPLQLAEFEEKPEMVEFLAAKCAKSTGSSAQRTEVKHVRFNEEVLYFEEERPLSCGARPPGQLKSILKNSVQYNTVTEKITRRTSLGFLNSKNGLYRCSKAEDVRYTSCIKEESSKTLLRLQKRMQKGFVGFWSSGVYVCSRGEPIPNSCEEKASLMVRGNKPPIFLPVPGKQGIYVLEAPGDIEPTQPTSAADSRAPADAEPNSSTCAAVNGAPVNVEPTPSQLAPDSGAPADVEPTHSTCAADTRAPADIEPTPSQSAPDSTAPSDIEKITSPCPSDSSESDEKYDLETGEEPSPVADLDEDIAEDFYDALESADLTGHSGSTVQVPGFLWEPDMLLLPVMPLMWFLTFLLSMMMWIRNQIRQVWYEENGQGPSSNRKDNPDAAGAEHSNTH
ncbi:neurogenic locus notch homolog protein 1-like isoform X1 [Mus musculus]|uniref:neurogenic locus notch homolog protein 1-like isoform X1 n=1 Tax=Mus musculus TaxID=10090 RepID=UPI001676E480|nr:neurogenic locus notch homolog protein 1-like isoform X1 [Mus musculus]